jgi:peptidylprolyl isomerase
MLQKGDFIKIDYTLTVKETGELIDTTIEEEAKKHNKYEENRKYTPELIILGEGWVPKGLEDALFEMEAGGERIIELAPEKAFGPRDANKIRTISLRKFKDRRGLTVGARVEVDGKIGVVKSIGAGRVVIDFNPPLSGRTLIYSVKVLEKITSDRERVVELIRKRLPVAKAEDFSVEISEKRVRIRLPEEIFLAEGLQYMKRALFNDITNHLGGIEEVVFEEVLKTRHPTEQSEQEQTVTQVAKEELGQP